MWIAAKAFYEKLGWRVDADFAKDDFRVVQLTPHNSECSIIFGKGVTSPKPGAVKSLTLAVDDIEAARNDLIGRGIKVSEIFHFADGPFNDATKNARLSGRDSEGRSYFSFASFEDPDFCHFTERRAGVTREINSASRLRNTDPGKPVAGSCVECLLVRDA